MGDYLLITLYAPLASWGDIAVGERRGSWDRPSRSAVLGLVAAALGLVRSDQDALDALDVGYGFAVRQDAAGGLLTDYHTTQTVAASALKKVRPRTRRQMLAAGKHETILSWRADLTDALATVALWPVGVPRWSLAELAAALLQPKFVLYAGRKSNVLGWPLMPEIVSADSAAGALAQRSYEDTDLAYLKPESGWGREIASDVGSGLLHTKYQVSRRDTHAHRARWQFADRIVEIGDD